ncbi:PEP-CTERM sorting domain-containing protein [Uliginosibacterium sp. H3]|uniref:PEP-CTERM sorting domain-containing protein n=1 Tax=Uliginosibacterium silvisoli TaxID=3114758 RepID=A0ABU6K6T3_9RHOO|nr:PEP-CTERM sorting domain-containing protein [Uliginosibacterium sp. H3]
MKFLPIAALALFAASPAFAGTSFLIDFEKNWDYGTAVDNTYSALGVEFVNVLGLSNDADFTYFTNAPSPLGTASAATFDAPGYSNAYLNVAGGVDGALSFYYSSPDAVVGAIKAYSGLNGTGTLLGTIDLTANTNDYSNWTAATFAFAGTAQSFDLTGSANLVGFDNIAAVPEASTYAMLLAGLGLMGLVARRSRR